uniref:Uncharacterized protein n=1 Tax=Arundo donax TaxID=35708 RepID=A0A0A9C2B2_ARUDO
MGYMFRLFFFYSVARM